MAVSPAHSSLSLGRFLKLEFSSCICWLVYVASTPFTLTNCPHPVSTKVFRTQEFLYRILKSTLCIDLYKSNSSQFKRYSRDLLHKTDKPYGSAQIPQDNLFLDAINEQFLCVSILIIPQFGKFSRRIKERSLGL